ncbi:MAG: HD domain-containing protein [Candidatus Aminicenantes bacterium]|nr:HD domain-containing protein [Candidatus Aminicenantes bacterium]
MKSLEADFRDRGLFVRLFKDGVYTVGGFVRDRLRGIPSEDVDLLVAGRRLEDVVRSLKKHGRVDLVGRSFGVIKFTRAGKTYDVALPRTDRAMDKNLPDGRGHKDIVVRTDPALPVEEDLRRRDFRCNSIALRLSDGTLIDPFEGRRDIRQRRLRLTNPAAFPEDPLRVVRAARFASVLGFRLDPEIYPVAQKVDLGGLSIERVAEEMVKILLDSSRPSRGLDELFKLGALRRLFPELYALTLVIQDSLFHPEKDAFGHHTVWRHTELTVDQARRLAERLGFPPPKALALLLAALYHDAGKAETTRWEFKRGRMAVTSVGHDLASERIARQAFRRLKIFSWGGFDVASAALTLIRTHHWAAELWQNRASLTKKAFNRLAAEAGGEIELVAALDAADRAGRGGRLVSGLDRQARWLLGKFAELNVTKESIRPLLLGRDLLPLGVPPGPGMGALLKEIYRRQLDGEFETKAAALRAAGRLLRPAAAKAVR